MKKKIILSILFIISLLPMLLNQYGGLKGVQEISGLANLCNPIGIVSLIIFFVGVWIAFKNTHINKILTIIGIIGVVVSEIYTFLTWYIPNYKDTINLQYSFNNVFPEFYVGLGFSLLMIIAYFYIERKIKE